MSANSKVLLIIVALIAFVVGVQLNSARIAETTDATTLLEARLWLGEGDADDSVKENLKQLTLVNFWASWCAPCRSEMPVFEAMYRANRPAGFQIIGVTIDSPEKAVPMLDSMDITYPILYAEATGMQLMAASGNPQGLLPYSLLLDANGKVLEQALGQVHEEDIMVWLEEHL